MTPQRRLTGRAAGTILGVALVPVLASADPAPSGDVCVAARPAASERSAATPSGSVGAARYAVIIDGRAEVALSETASSWVRGLDPLAPHSVVILADGRESESFFFRFEPDERELCLFLSPYYMTWQLWPIARTGAWCQCSPSAPLTQPSNSAS
jgi:hypothetical protein